MSPVLQSVKLQARHWASSDARAEDIDPTYHKGKLKKNLQTGIKTTTHGKRLEVYFEKSELQRFRT